MTLSINDDDFQLEKSDHFYSYQDKLTPKLDAMNKPFDQGIINEIVLWKVNRYAELEENTLDSINRIEPESKDIDVELTRDVLGQLLATKGIQLPMASTILRFKNKQIYQILDQRVYRMIYGGESLIIPATTNPKNIANQTSLYIKYLADLKIACNKLNIDCEKADRILYMADKRLNKNIKLRY